MKLSDLKALFGIEKLEVKQYKENGSYMATITDEDKNSFSIFTTKATNIDDVNDDTPVTMIDGKYYIGAVKEALNKAII